jgi:hypothetical protein
MYEYNRQIPDPVEIREQKTIVNLRDENCILGEIFFSWGRLIRPSLQVTAKRILVDQQPNEL